MLNSTSKILSNFRTGPQLPRYIVEPISFLHRLYKHYLTQELHFKVEEKTSGSRILLMKACFMPRMDHLTLITFRVICVLRVSISRLERLSDAPQMTWRLMLVRWTGLHSFTVFN